MKLLDFTYVNKSVDIVLRRNAYADGQDANRRIAAVQARSAGLRCSPSYATAFLPSMVFMTRSVTTMSAMPIGRQMSQLRMKPAKM